MTVWNLSRLIYTVRKLTGRFDLDQMPDAADPALNVSITNPSGIVDYINDFYLLDFPEHLRTLKLRDFYQFTTLPNVGTYNVPNNIYQIYDPVYVDGYQISWHQYPESFYRIWPEFNFIDQNLFIPDGTSGTASDPFVFTLTQTPIQQGTVSIGLQPNVDGAVPTLMETFTDQDSPCLLDQPLLEQFTNPGILTSNLGGSGTIDYLTGDVTLTYITAPPNGTSSSCHYHPYVASRPRDIMFFQQQLFLRPIPNDTYIIKLMSYMQPTVVISNLTNAGTNPTSPAPGVYSQFTSPLTDPLDGQQPLFQEWWQVLAYGAAIKILIEEGDYAEAEKLKGPFEENKLLAQRKCLKQLANQRIPTRYAESNQTGTAGWPVFPIY